MMRVNMNMLNNRTPLNLKHAYYYWHTVLIIKVQKAKTWFFFAKLVYYSHISVNDITQNNLISLICKKNFKKFVTFSKNLCLKIYSCY